MKIIAIIPARSGSKGLPDKNIAEVQNRPLMDYTIKTAIKSNCFDTVMVSTDSKEYAKIALNCGAEIPFLRSEITAGDKSSSWDAVREILKNYSDIGIHYDYVALLQPTSPLRSVEDIHGVIRMLEDEKIHNVVTVTETTHPVQWCFSLSNTCSMLEYAKSPYSLMRRQDLEKHYQENGAIYLVDAIKIMDKDYNFYLDECYAYIMPRERSIDIDTKMDLTILQAILENEYDV